MQYAFMCPCNASIPLETSISFLLCALPADEFKSYLEQLTKDKANGKHETLTKELSQGYN